MYLISMKNRRWTYQYDRIQADETQKRWEVYRNDFYLGDVVLYANTSSWAAERDGARVGRFRTRRAAAIYLEEMEHYNLDGTPLKLPDKEADGDENASSSRE